MRVALVHSYHHSDVPSGENVVVDAQVEALAAAGHEAVVVAQDNDTRSRRRTYPLEAAATVVTGRGARPVGDAPPPRPRRGARAQPVPQLRHPLARPLAGPARRDAAQLPADLPRRDPAARRAPLHRLRRRPVAGVRHRCFQHSRVATLPLALATRGGAACRRRSPAPTG